MGGDSTLDDGRPGGMPPWSGARFGRRRFGEGSRAPISSGLKRPILVAAPCLLTQTIWLRHLGIPVPFQLGVLLIGVVAGWVGWVVIRPVVQSIHDGSTRAGLALLAGISILTAVATVLFHERIGSLVGLASRPAAARASVILVASAGLIIWLFTRARPTPKAAAETPVVVWMCLIVGALAMSALTIHGVGNTPDRRMQKLLPKDYPAGAEQAPNWGRAGDYVTHLVLVPADIVKGGLPGELEVAHYGVQVWVLSASAPLPSETAILDPLRAAKILAAGVWFALFALGRFVFLNLFGLSPRVSGLGTAALALFAPINVPLFQVARSPYLGLVGSSGGMYHNITQLYSVALGIAALALIGSSQRGKTLSLRAFTYGIGFLVVSAWFKPTLFLVFAPTIGVLALLKMRRRPAAALIGSALLGLPVLAWLVYPVITGAERYSRGIAFDPVGGYVVFAGRRFPDWLVSTKWLLALAVLAASFAVWAVPACSWAARVFRRRRGVDLRQPSYGGPKELSLVLVASLAIGLAIAFLFVEQVDTNHGNPQWPAAAAYVLALPVLFRLIVEIRSRWWRWVTWGLLALHLWGGLLHLYLVVTIGKL